MHFGALDLSKFNFTTHYTIQGETFAGQPQMINPDENADKFYILVATKEELYPVIIKVTFKEEDGFLVGGQKIENIHLNNMRFFYSVYDETFLIAGNNNDDDKYTILRYDYVEKRVKHVKHSEVNSWF